MKKVLITGAGGFLGSHLVHHSKKRYDVFGCSMSSPIDLPIDKSYYFDLTHTDKLLSILDKINPDYIIHSAAISSEQGCCNDKENAFLINVRSVDQIGKWCEKNRRQLIFVSTDLVFDGEDAPYDEEAPTKPSMEYGRLKRAGEQVILPLCNASIIRLPLLYGFGLGSKRGILHQFVQKCHQNIEQSLFIDEFRTPAYVEDVAFFLLKVLGERLPKIIHLGGTELVSRYELAQAFCQELGLDNSNIAPVLRKDVGLEYRPKNAALKSNLAIAIGWKPSSISEALRKCKKVFFN